MEFFKSWKFMMVIGVVLTVVAISGVIYGVMTHDEPGFIDGPVWEREDFPLALCVRSYDEDHVTSADLDNARYVVSLINDRLRFDAYVVTPGPECRVLLTYAVPVEAGWQDPGGSAEVGEGHCTAVTANVTGELRTLTVYHELGHCLGLAHDTEATSIMRRVQRPTADGMFPPWISDSDVVILRDEYAPR